jgi:hypothetical protein
MPIIFTCEKCGNRFKVDERMHGRKGRCSHCGQVMKIPGERVAAPAHAPKVGASADAEPQFRLSPPEPLPMVADVNVPSSTAEPARAAPVGPHHSVFGLAPPIVGAGLEGGMEHHGRFELIDEDAEPAGVVSPEVAHGLKEIAEFEKDRKGYTLDGDRGGAFALLGLKNSGPAGWVYTKWRAGVNSVLKLLRWIDTWAYLVSVPFLVLMIFGIAVANRQLVHSGAAVVVLANYGRFWADLLALFVRPFKDGPIQGIAFLFPPYSLYYLATRWDKMKKIVRRIATSCIPIFLVVLIYGFLPSVNPEIKDVKGFGARLEAGKDELDKEIQGDLRGLEKKLLGAGEAAKAGPKPKETDAPLSQDNTP